MKYYFLFVLLASIAAGYYLPDDKDQHWEHYHQENAVERKPADGVSSSSTSYDIEGLNDLVGQVSFSKKQKQADALANVWHITKADLESKVSIFGERLK